jgi:hypothetical protein
MSSRANADTTLNTIPFCSWPIDANRNSSNRERSMAAEAERAMFVAKPDLLIKLKIGGNAPGASRLRKFVRSSSNAFPHHLRRDSMQLTAIDYKFSIRLFAGSYKQLISVLRWAGQRTN